MALSIAIPVALIAAAVVFSTVQREPPGVPVSDPPAREANDAPVASSSVEFTGDRRAAPMERAGEASRCPERGEIPTGLLEAVACGDAAETTRLLRDGAKPDLEDPRPAFAGYTALHHAVARGDLQAIQLLLDAGARADTPDRHGNAPLHLLALGDRVVNDLEIARVLVHAGADLLRANGQGHTALQALQARPRLARASPELLRYLSQTTHQLGLLAQTRSYLNRESGPPNAFSALKIDGPRVAGVFDMPGTAPEPEARVRETLDSWASAWNRGDPGAYLAHYAAEFQPAEGGTREEWARTRRERIAEARNISVQIEGVSIRLDGDRATASFTQTYRARGVRDVSHKKLVLVLSDGAWRIVSEQESRR